VALEQHDKTYVTRALEASIHVGLVILLAAACLLILRPLIPLLTWGVIIAVAVHPAFRRLQKVVGGRQSLAAAVCTLALLAVIIIPVVLLAQSLVDVIQFVTVRLKEGTVVIPPPPPTIQSWPIIGAPLQKVWDLASKDLTEAVRNFVPQIKSALPGLLSASAGIGMTALQLLLSVVVAGILLANAHAVYNLTSSLANRLFGDKGAEFQRLIGATIRSVTFGILGVAAIQSVLAALGFLVAGLPAVGLWTVLFVFAAVVQAGILVLLPAIIYVFVVGSITKAVIFLVWCIFVGTIDNVLKPILLGRGVAVPVVVVFLGAIGGFLAMGIIGLFVGAIVLSVGYKLFLTWLDESPVVNQELTWKHVGGPPLP
jgi:predicted PurR-regulated permease PerM